MAFIYSGISLRNGRSTNMDSLLLSERIISNHAALLAVVCDGVGSMSDGAFAASQAIEMMNKWFHELNDTLRIGLRMRDEVLRLNSNIIELANERLLKTASTFTSLLFIGNKYYCVHIGDTRAYYFSPDEKLTPLTIDDVSEFGRLTGYIGRYKNLVPFCTEGDSSKRMFLICSDGLYKRVEIDSEVVSKNLKSVSGVKKAVTHLANSAIESGEKDNISVAIIIPKSEDSK